MKRVNRNNRCPACGHDSWCLLGKDIFICMRMVSERKKVFTGGEVGYIHEYGHKPQWVPPEKPKPLPVINVKRVMNDWRKAYGTEGIEQLAKDLGVSVQSLTDLETMRTHHPNSWGWPMKDGYGNYIGIRIRNNLGKKWALTSSQAGIFIPLSPVQKRVLIVEGPTDAAAALTLGFYAIGRPSCSGGVPHIMAFVRKNHVQEVVIVADNDDPGIRGASDLQRMLPVPSCILLLPTKDIREFIGVGDKSTLDAMIEQLVWTRQREVA